MKRANQAFLGVLLMSCLLNYGCTNENPTEPERRLTPDFVLKDLAGNNFTLSQHNGHVVVLLFFKST
jgi:hypothetical protein